MSLRHPYPSRPLLQICREGCPSLRWPNNNPRIRFYAPVATFSGLFPSCLLITDRSVTERETRAVPKPDNDMIRGTLDMLILKVISIEAMHGWGISERIQQLSDEALQVNQGSLYSSLHRLTRQGWIRSEWRRTPNNRRARYYLLTAAGERQLGVEHTHWARLSGAVDQIMGLT